jgi:hypothetical protein
MLLEEGLEDGRAHGISNRRKKEERPGRNRPGRLSVGIENADRGPERGSLWYIDEEVYGPHSSL